MAWWAKNLLCMHETLSVEGQNIHKSWGWAHVPITLVLASKDRKTPGTQWTASLRQ